MPNAPHSAISSHVKVSYCSRTDEPYRIEGSDRHACRLRRPWAVPFSQSPAGRGPCAPTWAAASLRPGFSVNPLPPPPPKNLSAGREESASNPPFVGPEEKWRSARAGNRAARVTRRSPGPRSPRSGPLWATPRNREPLGASAIFPYSLGLPPRPRWLRVSLPAADRDPGWAGWANAPRGWTEGGEARRKRKGRAASRPRRGVERAACVRRERWEGGRRSEGRRRRNESARRFSSAPSLGRKEPSAARTLY